MCGWVWAWVWMWVWCDVCGCWLRGCWVSVCVLRELCVGPDGVKNTHATHTHAPTCTHMPPHWPLVPSGIRLALSTARGHQYIGSLTLVDSVVHCEKSVSTPVALGKMRNGKTHGAEP